jgi:murein DD-endopeptidase MepM/ murein hydrolase activator NlpD
VGGSASPERVAQEFESLFLAQLLSIMQKSVESSGLFEGGPGKEVYTAMMNQELGRSLAASGGLGLSRMIEQYLEQSARGKGAAEVGERVETVARKEHSGRLQQLANFRTSSDLGWRRDPFTGEWSYHRGIDLAAPFGTRVPSLTSGRVVFSGIQNGFGNTVVVENNKGIRTRYAHLSKLSVNEGEEVSKGQEIGSVGSSGRATGNHLHLEMEKDGRVLDPVAEMFGR